MADRWRDEDEAAARKLQQQLSSDAAAGLRSTTEAVSDDFSEPAANEDGLQGGAVPYAEIVKRFLIVRQSYIEGSQGEVGAAVAGCHHWRQRADACFRQVAHHSDHPEKTTAKGAQPPSEAQCMKLQLQFMLCMGERVLPQEFERMMGCMKSKGDISQCEEPLLEIMNGLEQKAQVENRQREGMASSTVEEAEGLLTKQERQRIFECDLTNTTQHEIDCMIPKVCSPQHEALLRCMQAGGGASGTAAVDAARCIEPAKQALQCWGAFNHRRAKYEEVLARANSTNLSKS